MRTDELRHMIERGISEEERTGWLSGELLRVAQAQGKRPNRDAIAIALALLTDYVRAVPSLLEEVSRAAREARCSHAVEPMLRAAEEYFLAPDDLIPDRYGLGGLLDDAFLAVGLMQAASKRAEKAIGVPLLKNGLDDMMVLAHACVTAIMGPKLVAELERKVADASKTSWFDRMLDQLRGARSSFPLQNDPHPLWGNASTRDVIDTQIGALGIYPSWDP